MATAAAPEQLAIEEVLVTLTRAACLSRQGSYPLPCQSIEDGRPRRWTDNLLFVLAHSRDTRRLQNSPNLVGAYASPRSAQHTALVPVSRDGCERPSFVEHTTGSFTDKGRFVLV
jgi:hypothetical protein